MQLDGRILSLSQQWVMTRWNIEKLGDEYGQYTLVASCATCGHERRTEPHELSRICGWDTTLSEIAPRMKCSACGAKDCHLRAFPPKKPRGYTSLPK